MSIKGKIAAVVAFVLVFALGWLSAQMNARDSRMIPIQVRENSSEYSFINPLLLVDNSQVLFSDFRELEGRLETLVSKEVSNGNTKGVSVYFRDMNSGRWAGVGEKVKYIPSSMLKVATLIGYLKLSRNDAGVLEERVDYQSKVDEGQWYKPSRLLPNGQQKVSSLLQEMILRSDNAATKTLDRLHLQEILEVYKDMRLPDSLETNGDDDFISPEEFSSLYRVLYNSTYLPEVYSESALKLLSFTEFDKGLVAGVPKNTIVAHKFGEHTRLINGVVDERQLHDCGIVYYPRHPYFLCVMTRGTDFTKLEKVIASASQIVYDEMEKRHGDD
jgi:beta-lactamase class A